jgi:two-component system copper resistance phosphate regulon response regulator CusR
LIEAGFVIDLARDRLDGLHLVLTEDYDLAANGNRVVVI